MDSNNQIIIYQTEDGQTQVDVRLENDMIWLTRQQIAVLFGRDYRQSANISIMRLKRNWQVLW